MNSIKIKLIQYKDEFSTLVNANGEVNFDMSSMKNGTETDDRGRARLLRNCAICGNKLLNGEYPNGICNSCKGEYELPEKRDDYPEWALALITLEAERYDYERGCAIFVNSYTDAGLERDGTLNLD